MGDEQESDGKFLEEFWARILDLGYTKCQTIAELQRRIYNECGYSIAVGHMARTMAIPKHHVLAMLARVLHIGWDQICEWLGEEIPPYNGKTLAQQRIEACLTCELPGCYESVSCNFGKLVMPAWRKSLTSRCRDHPVRVASRKYRRAGYAKVVREPDAGDKLRHFIPNHPAYQEGEHVHVSA